MATRTFEATGNWNDVSKWDGGAALPVAGDAVIIADGKVCTINISTPALVSIGTNGDAGTGRCIVSNGVTVTFDTMNAGDCGISGFFRFDGGAGTSCTLDGHVRGGNGSSAYGCYNFAAGTVNIDTCTGGSADNAYGCRNNATGTVNITTCTGGSASGAYGCYLNNNTSPTGRCYITGSVKAGFDGANPVSGLFNRATNAGYHFLAYGAKLYDRFGNEETSNFTAINSIAGVEYGWLITAEIDSAADLAAIDNLTGDANVSFVQTGNFEVTSPPNIGNVTAFLGRYTGYDAVAQRSHEITFNSSPEIDFAIFRNNGGTIEKSSIVLNTLVAVGAIEASGFIGLNSGTVENCVVSGELSEDGSISYASLVTENVGELKYCYSIVPFVPLLYLNKGGTVTNCYHLSPTDQGVTQLTTTQMQGKGMNLDYINIWQEDIGGRNNNWLPYIRNGRYIKRRRVPVGAL